MPELASPKEISSSASPLDKPLKSDAIDIGNRYAEGTVATLAGTGIGVAPILAKIAYPEMAVPIDAVGSLATLGIMALPNLYNSGETVGGWLFKRGGITGLERTHSVSDNDLGFRADRCVYKGKEPLEIGRQRVENGDNFYYIQLPNILSASDATPEQVNIALDVYDFAFSQIQEKTADKNYRFVAIEINPEIHASIQDFAKGLPGERKDVFAGKDVLLREGEKKLVLFTKEEFEQLATSPQEAFQKAVESLDDQMFSHFISLSRQASTQEEKEKVKQLASRRLSAVLHREIEAYFNSMPEVSIDRVGKLHAPVRKITHPHSMIRKTKEGFFFVQVNTSTGEARWVPLDRLLKTELQPVDAILSSNSGFKKAQIAYVLSKMLDETSMDDLVRERVVEKDALLAQVRSSGIHAPSSVKSVKEFADRSIHIPPKSPLVGLTRKVRPLLAAMMLYAGASGGMAYLENSDAVKGLLGDTEHVETIERPIGFNGMPMPGMDWKIEGTMPTDGYYITSTSHEFVNKQWKRNETIERKIDVPTMLSVEEHPEYLQLSRIQAVNALHENAFRVPIKDKTKLAALRIAGPKGEDVSFSVFELSDGTIEVRLDTGVLDAPAWVSIGVGLVPSDNTVVHATEPTKPLDESGLDREVRSQLEQVRQKEVTERAPALIRAEDEKHEYSLDPVGKERLESALTDEEVVNAIDSLSGCSCEVCNTEFTLLANTVGVVSPVNMAEGYIATSSSLAGADDDFLRSETRHAFGINRNGGIQDATATRMASDVLTQQYRDVLQHPSSGGMLWEEMQAEMISKAERQKRALDVLKLAGLLSATSASVLALSKGLPFAKKYGTKENIQSVMEHTVSTFFTENDLQKAYDVFQWMSYGNTQSSHALQNTSWSFASKSEAVARMKQHTAYEKLGIYLDSPKAFERILRDQGMELHTLDVAKLRFLASYLISS